MTTSRHVDEELRVLVDGVRHLNEGTSSKLQTLSLMTVVWPLLPALPPEPPSAVAELLRENLLDSCDVCGSPGTPPPLLKRRTLTASSRSVSPDTGTQSASGIESPLAKMMAEIEKKMNVTLKSIDTTAQRTDKLGQETKTLDLTGRGSITDEELVNRLKYLMKEKSKREERVKALELKEQQLKESLKTAIEWAKTVDRNRD